MFQEITLINYCRPISERAKTRKSVGPYTWRPAKPGVGRGFYQSRKGLWVDPRGSTFDLRIEEANDHLRGSRLAYTNGYYCDSLKDQMLAPIVARLPHGRGFLAGWTMGEGMYASLNADIYETIEDAARAAHNIAEHDAEQERDREFEEENEDD